MPYPNKRCICGQGFYDSNKSKSRKYCKTCEALAKRRKRPVIMIRGGKNENDRS